MIQRPARALAVLLLAAAAAAPSPALGDGEAGAEAPPATPPSMDDVLEQSDPKSVMAIKLPREWKQIKSEGLRRGQLIGFKGRYTERDAGEVWLTVDATTSRGTVSLWTQLRNGEMQADCARSGPGWVEGCSIDKDEKRHLATFARCVEKEGQVYVFLVLAHQNSFESVKSVAAKMLDTAQVKGAVPREGLPKGWTAKKAGEFDVWTDHEDPSAAAKPLPVVAEARNVLVKALKGKPFDEARPVIKAYKNAGRFGEETKEMYGEEHKNASWDPYARAPMVVLMDQRQQTFAQAVHLNSARQYLVQYFGGDPPFWVLVGLQRYGVVGAMSGGKPQEPPKEWIARGKAAAAASTHTFDWWVATGGGSEVPDVDKAGDELWAWHFFVRHATGGKKYRKAYDASLDALRATGDPLAARKAWEGTDFAAMAKDFKDWAAKWEP